MRIEWLSGAMPKPPTPVTSTTPLLSGLLPSGLFVLVVLVSLFSRTPALAQTGSGEIWGHVADQDGPAARRARGNRNAPSTRPAAGMDRAQPVPAEYGIGAHSCECVCR